jgi:hypothetical protein
MGLVKVKHLRVSIFMVGNARTEGKGFYNSWFRHGDVEMEKKILKHHIIISANIFTQRWVVTI